MFRPRAVISIITPAHPAAAKTAALALALSFMVIIAFPPFATPIAAPSKPQEWRIVDTSTGDPIAFDEFSSRIAGTDVIYLGEQHRNRAHIEAAITVLEVLQQRQRLPILGLEMFSWDGQTALDRYLLDAAPAKMQFLQESRWQENWGGVYEEYEPLVETARRHHLPVIALNPPRPLVRKIAREGLRPDALDAEIARWGLQGEQFVRDAAYQDTILQQLRACHRGLPPNAYQRMYEASLFRDEGMAKTISDATQRLPEAGPIVSYTGAGHIQYRLPIPNRVARRHPELRQITVYLVALDPALTQDLDQLIKPAIADYLWLTPPSEHGPSARCS
jgi:uncharacterized iron-regulated protein